MKKTLVVAAVVVLMVAFFSSCKTHEKCPAYTKLNKPQSEVLLKHS